jgi:hypothetical protein
MTRDETIALFLKGKDAWNAWAEEMLAQRKALEESGAWQSDITPLAEPTPENAATLHWMDRARVDFFWIRLIATGQPGAADENSNSNSWEANTISLEADVLDFEQFIFPSNVYFYHATFSGDAEFSRATFHGFASFEGATFCGDATFKYSTFISDAKFSSTSFSGSTYFDSSRFGGYAWFDGATIISFTWFFNVTFSGDARFDGATFGKDAWFHEATFSGDAQFGGATFSGDANFNRATFSGDANFNLANFEKPVRWKDASFEKAAQFTSLRSNTSFALKDTGFAQPPDFSEAQFHVPPVLDDMTVANPVRRRDFNWCLSDTEEDEARQADPRPRLLQMARVADKQDDYRKFRVLRKLATEAGDHQKEMEFFARETQCRRFWKDKPFGEGAGRFWFGWLYEKTSDFGRSFARPFVGLLFTWVFFSYLYAILKTNTFDLVEAAYVSLRHTLLISGLSKTRSLDDAIETLYGDKTPDPVAWLMVLQPFICVIWFFLFALALRNHFRIK